VGNIKPGGTAEDFGGLLRYTVERQASRREDLPYLLRPVHSWGHAGRIAKIPSVVETITVVAAIATSREIFSSLNLAYVWIREE
jgi:hypothetical protein